MTPLKQASLLHFHPRNSTYTVTQHNISIKFEHGWREGCIYVDNSSGKVYARPYKMFDELKWSWS